MILAASTYHGGLNSGYSFPLPMDYARVSWLKFGHMTASTAKSRRLFTQIAFSVKQILWTEFYSVTYYLQKILKDELTGSFNIISLKEAVQAQGNMKLIVAEVRRRNYHTYNNDKTVSPH